MTTSSFRPRLARGLMMATMAGAACGAWAQTVDTIPVAPAQAETPPDPQPGPENASGIPEEIVVTATKRAEPVREIPATIAVLSGEALEREGVQSIDQIVSQVPGVNLTDDGLGQAKRVTIRGISTDTNANFTAGTLFGDIPFTDPFVPKVQLDPNPFDMKTVEVLKGPQGTLFGGTGLNGLIRYVPEAPDLDDFRLKYFTQLTSYPGNGDHGWTYGAVMNAPLVGETLGLRLMAFDRDGPGFVDDDQAGKNDVNRTRQYGYRGMLAWQPGEWKVSLLGARQRALQKDVGFTDNFDGDLSRSNTAQPSPTESSYNLANLGVQREFSWADVISQTSWVEKEFDANLDASRAAAGGQLPVLVAAGYNHSKAFTQEIRLVSNSDDSGWKWLVGGFHFDEDLYDCAEAGALSLPDLGLPLPLPNGLLATPCRDNAAKLAGRFDIAQLVGNIKLREQALFGELTREFGDDWEATVGARLYRTRSGGTVASNGLLYTLAQNGGQPGLRDATEKEQGLSPKASIVFHPSREFRAYFTASRGFRFGGPQLGASTVTTQVPDTYKSDTLWNYELGLRTDWFDQTLRLDASAYQIDWKNPQVAQTSNDSLVTFIDNVGGVQGHGVEVALRYLPPFVRGLTLDTSVSWNRTVTTKTFDSATGATIDSGSPWPLAPRWQTSTTLAYFFPVRDWMLGSSLRHTYAGRACNTIECTGQVFGFRTLDLALTAAPGGDSFWPELSITLSNLTDERGISNVTTNALLGDTVSYIPPRALVVRIGGSF